MQQQGQWPEALKQKEAKSPPQRPQKASPWAEDNRRQERSPKNQSTPEIWVNIRHLGGGLTELANIAQMVTAITAGAMQIRVDNEDVREQAILTHEADKVGEDNPLNQLKGEMQYPITCTWKSVVLATSRADNMPEHPQVCHN